MGNQPTKPSSTPRRPSPRSPRSPKSPSLTPKQRQNLESFFDSKMRAPAEEAFEYFVNFHQIPKKLHNNLRSEGINGRHDWYKLAHEYAYIPNLAWLHKIRLNKRDLDSERPPNGNTYKKTNKWRAGDIVLCVNVPGAGERNIGKFVWTGRKLVDLDYDMVDDGALPDSMSNLAMKNPYLWSGQDDQYGDIIKNNHAVPVAFGPDIARRVNGCTTSTCVFEWNGEKWGVIIHPSMRGHVLETNGSGTLFWFDVYANPREPNEFGLYKVSPNVLKDSRVRTLLMQVPLERIFSASEDF